MTVRIWDSPATDVTGRNLATNLRGEESRTKPRAVAGDIVIGWGAKTDAATEFAAGITVLNHPDAIRKNRNKYSALTLMNDNRELADNIKAFCKANAVIAALNTHNMELPVIGRKNYHQGGEGFWLCLTNAQVESAIAAGAQYFQNYIDIADEFRLHVFGDNVIYAVKKVENATKEGWVSQRVDKVTDYAQKNNVAIDQATMNYVLGIIYGEHQLPDKIVRSNKRGWKFSSVRLNTLNNDLKAAAVRAVKAIGLDFGAVDCCIDNAGHVWIIEVNSAPGLEGTTLEKYTEAFQAKIAEIQRPAAANRAARGGRQNRVVAAAEIEQVIHAEHPAPAGNVVDPARFRMMMNAVNSPEEARRLLDLMGV